MALKTLKLILLSVFLLQISACAKERSIYQELGPDEDGVVSTPVPDDGSAPPAPEAVAAVHQLTPTEQDLVDKFHEGESDQLSFLVVEADSKKVLKNYFGEKPQRLASVSKIPTALGALENVRNVEVPKVKDMLKISNNGEASRYVRLAAKALDGVVIPTPPYPQKHSCPDEFLNDVAAAEVVYDWITSELPQVDWSDSELHDGAGCNYNNFMNSFQVAKILEYADSLGKAFDGKSFEDLLSINGVDGTWKNRNPEHKGYIFAKTGTLRPNANLSGYFYARRGGKYVKHYFSVFVNKKGAGEYSIKARNLIEGLLNYWINYYSVNEGKSVGTF